MMLRALVNLWRSPATPEARAERRLLFNVVLASIATAAVGLAIKMTSLSLFSHLFFVGSMFLVTALILWLSPLLQGESQAPSYGFAFLIGLVQGVAAFPGISRSGATIVAGKAAGMKGPAAARFAFVVSIPAILGASILSWLDVANLPNFNTSLIFSALCGIILAAFAGYVSLILLTAIIRRARLQMFAYYCAAVGIITLIMGAVR